MKQQTATDNITKLQGPASLDATHKAAFDHATTAGSDRGDHVAGLELLLEREYHMENADLPAH
eukprot:3079753-Pyramimonas_sp.AAC.1